jgi:hypothetical protein
MYPVPAAVPGHCIGRLATHPGRPFCVAHGGQLPCESRRKEPYLRGALASF